jgi:hypothetical protein
MSESPASAKEDVNGAVFSLEHMRQSEDRLFARSLRELPDGSRTAHAKRRLRGRAIVRAGNMGAGRGRMKAAVADSPPIGYPPLTDCARSSAG